MIIEIPDGDSIVRWKKNDKDEWKSAEISELIKAYEKRPTGDCIGREALRKAFHKRIYYFDKSSWDEANALIDNAPTVPQVTVFAEDADEKAVEDLKVELQSVIDARPEGEWIPLCQRTVGEWEYKCSNCNRRGIMNQENFCPSCGADMRKGDVDVDE